MELEVKLCSFLTLLLDVGEWSASCAGHFTLGKEPLGTHCVGGWTGTRAGLDTSKKRKISCPLLGTEPS